jgi:hypothetical protein
MNDRRRLRLVRNLPTLAAALERYLAEVSARKKSHLQEQSVARIWLQTGLANRNLARVTAQDLQRLRDEWLQDRKPGTGIPGCWAGTIIRADETSRRN